MNNNKIYKLNMNKFTDYITNVNLSINNDLDEDSEKFIEVFDNLKHTQPEYMIQALIPAIQYALLTWLQSHGYHVDRSGVSIFTDFGNEFINYAKFLKGMCFLHELTEDEDHE